jgi:hypothetical protein
MMRDIVAPRVKPHEEVGEQPFEEAPEQAAAFVAFPTLKPTASELGYDDLPTYAPPKKDAENKAKPEPTPSDKPKTVEVPALLKDFEAKFSGAGKIIEASPKAVEMVKEAEDAGAKFGGFAEDGPGGDAWPYTIADTVYIPKAHTDAITAMSDFLFELNNAIRAPKFAEVQKEAKKGKSGSLTAKTYAQKKVELEVEGMLQLGEVWFETKKAAGKEKDATWSAHDGEFYLAEYKAVKAGKKTKDVVVKDVLQRKYAEGTEAGKTVEQAYMEQYDAINGIK